MLLPCPLICILACLIDCLHAYLLFYICLSTQETRQSIPTTPNHTLAIHLISPYTRSVSNFWYTCQCRVDLLNPAPLQTIHCHQNSPSRLFTSCLLNFSGQVLAASLLSQPVFHFNIDHIVSWGESCRISTAKQDYNLTKSHNDCILQNSLKTQ